MLQRIYEIIDVTGRCNKHSQVDEVDGFLQIVHTNKLSRKNKFKNIKEPCLRIEMWD